MMAIGRSAFRFVGFLALVACAIAEALVYQLLLAGKPADLLRYRSRWLHRCSKRLLRFLNIHVDCVGTPPANGLLISNHLSYVDILVLGSACPLVFVSKSEVCHWPVIGWGAMCAGTLFIDRSRKSDVLRVSQAFKEVVDQGIVLALFPEGTSSDGRKVMPFYSSLFAPAADQGWPVTPAWISYTLEDGDPGKDICYWGDMTFFPHFLKMLSKRSVKARLVIHHSQMRASDRKELTARLHTEVCKMAEEHALNPLSQRINSDERELNASVTATQSSLS